MAQRQHNSECSFKGKPPAGWSKAKILALRRLELAQWFNDVQPVTRHTRRLNWLIVKTECSSQRWWYQGSLDVLWIVTDGSLGTLRCCPSIFRILEFFVRSQRSEGWSNEAHSQKCEMHTCAHCMRRGLCSRRHFVTRKGFGSFWGRVYLV